MKYVYRKDFFSDLLLLASGRREFSKQIYDSFEGERAVTQLK